MTGNTFASSVFPSGRAPRSSFWSASTIRIRGKSWSMASRSWPVRRNGSWHIAVATAASDYTIASYYDAAERLLLILRYLTGPRFRTLLLAHQRAWPKQIVNRDFPTCDMRALCLTSHATQHVWRGRKYLVGCASSLTSSCLSTRAQAAQSASACLAEADRLRWSGGCGWQQTGQRGRRPQFHRNSGLTVPLNFAQLPRPRYHRVLNILFFS